MKTMIIIVTISAMMLGAAAYAQTDTTKNPKPVTPVQTQPAATQPQSQTLPTVQPTQPTTTQVQPTTPSPSPMLNNPGTPTGWTPVNNQNIPDNLRQTLINTPTY